jgi:hypothetical protein
MKKTIALVVLFSAISVAAQNNTSDPETRDREVFRTYGYCYGQQKSIEQIKREFPHLRIPIFQAETAFNVTFGKSCKAVGDIFSDSVRQKLNSEFDKYFSSTAISETVAKDFIATIEARSKGDIETPVKETLLTFNPDFREKPALEFMRGFTRPFSSAGHSKAKGLSVEIKVPMSWISREGNRPNIVQFFKAEYGRSDASMLIGIRQFDPPRGSRITQRDIDAMFSPKGLREMVPDGATVVESKPIILEGQKGGMLVYDATMERLDISISMRTLSYTIFYKNRLISVEFSVGDLTQNRTKSIELFAKYRTLFVMIANSLVIRDAYAGN